MTHPPRWLTTLNRVSEHRREVALWRLGQCVAESESLRRAEQELNSQLTNESASHTLGGDSAKLDLERLHQRREHRNELLAALSELQVRQEISAAKIAQQRDTVQQQTSKSHKLERLGERITAQQEAAQTQAANRMILEELAGRSAAEPRTI